MPDDPTRVLASMGNYVFSTDLLVRELYADAENPRGGAHEARMISARTSCRRSSAAPTCMPTTFRPTASLAIPSARPSTGGTWERWMPTTKPAWNCARSLRTELGSNRQWLLRTAGYSDAPAKFVFDDEGRRGNFIDSIIAGGTSYFGRLRARVGGGRRDTAYYGLLVGGLDSDLTPRYLKAGEEYAELYSRQEH